MLSFSRYTPIRRTEIKSGYTHFAEADVALAKITPCFENGKSTVFRGLTGGVGAGTTELHIVRLVLVSPEYALIFLKCPQFIESGIPRMTGTAGQKRVPTEYFACSPFPLPPLAEQRRIVAKVDELMALCDRLEAAQTVRERGRDRLLAASLRLLGIGTDADARRKHAHFYLGNLPRLAASTAHILEIRNAILNLAVHGHLVAQDPGEVPAPSFGVPASVDGRDRIDMRLPQGWTWARVESVAEARLGKMLDKAKNAGKPYRYLRNTNVHWFDVRVEDLKEVRIEESEVDRFLLRNGDVLICEGGHGIGRTAVWRSDEDDVVFQKALHRVRPGPFLNSDFFAQCMAVYSRAGVLQTYFTGVGIPHLTGRALSRLLFPLPPPAEQRRIVSKVHELMGICDRLEAQLTTGRTEGTGLLESILHQTLAEAS